MSIEHLLPYLKSIGELSLSRYVGSRITGHLVQQNLQWVILCVTTPQILVDLVTCLSASGAKTRLL